MAEEKRKKSLFKVILEASALGINFVLCVVIGVIIGLAIDNFAGTFPVFFIIFLLAGFVAGVKEVFRFTKKMSKEDGQGSNKENK